MTIKQDIANLAMGVMVAIIIFLVSARVFPTAASELHIILSVMTYLAFYIRLQAIDDKHEILQTIKEGGCKK